MAASVLCVYVCVCRGGVVLAAQGLIDGQYLQTKRLPVSQTS